LVLFRIIQFAHTSSSSSGVLFMERMSVRGEPMQAIRTKCRWKHNDKSINVNGDWTAIVF